jgi:hypothetical protein
MGLPWIRIYNDLPDHPKSDQLSAMTGEPRAWTHVVELWLWASRVRADGDLSGLHEAVIAKRAGWSGDAAAFVDALRQSGFIDGDQLHGWGEYQGAHAKKLEKDRTRIRQLRDTNKYVAATVAATLPATPPATVAANVAGTVPPLDREEKEKEINTKNLALFAPAPSAAPIAIEPKRRGRPPKDQSPEAEADRRAEREDGESWIAAARALIGLTAQQAPWSQATWMTFRQARKKRGIQQLMDALAGLAGDQWASRQGLGTLLSATVIEKGLANASRRNQKMGVGINSAWDQILSDMEAANG